MATYWDWASNYTAAGTNAAAWPIWVGQSTGAATTTPIIWGAWNVTAATTITYGTNVVWSDWLTTPARPAAPVLTAQQLQKAETQRRAAIAERQREEREATERATALLTESLTEAQAAEFAKDQTFTIVSADGERVYRVRRGWSGNVDLMRNGKVVRRYCAHPVERCPDEDNMLAQKLLLETDEAAFLRIANVHAA